MRIYASPTYALGSDYMMMPGSRLEVGPHGKLYETLGADRRTYSKGRLMFGEEEAIATAAHAQAEVAMSDPDERAAAKRELARMKSALTGWLKFRAINDEVASGKRKARIPRSLAAATIQRDRDWAGEQKLADDLYLLLSQVYSVADLPTPSVKADPNAAVKLANIVISGTVSSEAPGPQAQGIWPILILTVGGVLLFTTTSWISNRAEVEKEKERMLCVRSGACTDYGFWLKVASVAVVGWFVWDKVGLRERVEEFRKPKRRARRRRR